MIKNLLLSIRIKKENSSKSNKLSRKIKKNSLKQLNKLKYRRNNKTKRILIPILKKEEKNKRRR